MPDLKQSIELLRNMGFRYVRYRIGHLMKTQTRYYIRNFPIAPAPKDYITLESWRKSTVQWFLPDSPQLNEFVSPPYPSCLDGTIKFFNSEFRLLGKEYDWVTNPETKFKYKADQHWSLINDFSSASGDIKFVWEKSRFAFIYDLIRYDAFSGSDHSDWIWKEILSWIAANPINAGPNYKCSQEISLRSLAWISALYFYKQSSSLSSDVFAKIQHVLYWQLKHVFDHIDFSRIAVRNNHAITETLALYIGGTVFPDFPNAAAWKLEGKKWFEQEVAYQIYEDGTYLQFSMNYHRVVIQLLSLAISFAKANNEEFADVVYSRAYASLEFLSCCQDKQTGFLPNYGSNDGALFFPLSNSEYRDFRPQLNALHHLLTGLPLYEHGSYAEEAVWWNVEKLSVKKFPPIKSSIGWKTFPDGGYAILREENGFSFIRCGRHKDRPAQADNLHLDIWLNGSDLLHDAGSYKYNTSPELTAWFMGSLGHNTVMIGNNSQMLKGPRFIWFNWSQAEELKVRDTSEFYEFQGQIAAFGHIAPGIKHKRTIQKVKSESRWVIIDELINKPDNLEMMQVWHPLNNQVTIQASTNDQQLLAESGKGWRSLYYGLKEETDFIQFRTNQNLITTIISL